MGLLKSGDDNDWEKIVIDLLSLIENFIQREDADRETLERLCLKPHIETLMNSSLPIDIRKKDTRHFLNSLNEFNDGISKTPKTFVASRIKYNQIELDFPEERDRFFVDFNKWTISTTIKSIEAAVDSAYINDALEIKYSKISSWDLQIESKEQTLRLYLSEHLKHDSLCLSGIYNKKTSDKILIIIKFDKDVKGDLEKIFTDRHVKKMVQLPKVPESLVLQPKFNIAVHDILSKSSEASITPENDTNNKQIIKLLKDANLDHGSSSFDPTIELTNFSQSCIGACNAEFSLNIDNPSERQRFENIRITSSTSNHSRAKLQILDAERHNVSRPSKQRSKLLKLKKQTNNKGEEGTNGDKLSNDMFKEETSKQSNLQNQDGSDGDFIMVEPNNDTTDITITENQMNLSGQEFRLSEEPKFPNLMKRKTLDSNEDEAEKPRFNNLINLIKKNKFYKEQLKVNKRNSPIKSEKDFWNPSEKDITDSIKYDADDEVVERMRAQFPMEFFRELIRKNTSIPKSNDEKQESSSIISSNNGTTHSPEKDNIVNVERRSSKYADEKLDEEIRRLLLCIGETISRQFKALQKANEIRLTQGLGTQEGRNELASLEQSLIEMEKFDSENGKI
ncbi:hypothetical protein C1645_736136 [Glomus cerebriforme]|uniref:Uncharacterized protein n=1 Tax=Glomus cerebriforme TaxID=658196 RepID=A0A397T3F0_9GLOM|nr:hypothetical protein C1645_736136 [Glomus cerebriforme]